MKYKILNMQSTERKKKSRIWKANCNKKLFPQRWPLDEDSQTLAASFLCEALLNPRLDMCLLLSTELFFMMSLQD